MGQGDVELAHLGDRSQNPTDVPSSILGQLGNRVQHALRTFTPADATALRKTVSTFPKSADYDIAEMLTSLGIGERR